MVETWFVPCWREIRWYERPKGEWPMIVWVTEAFYWGA